MNDRSQSAAIRINNNHTLKHRRSSHLGCSLDEFIPFIRIRMNQNQNEYHCENRLGLTPKTVCHNKQSVVYANSPYFSLTYTTENAPHHLPALNLRGVAHPMSCSNTHSQTHTYTHPREKARSSQCILYRSSVSMTGLFIAPPRKQYGQLLVSLTLYRLQLSSITYTNTALTNNSSPREQESWTEIELHKRRER